MPAEHTVLLYLAMLVLVALTFSIAYRRAVKRVADKLYDKTEAKVDQNRNIHNAEIICNEAVEYAECLMREVEYNVCEYTKRLTMLIGFILHATKNNTICMVNGKTGMLYSMSKRDEHNYVLTCSEEPSKHNLEDAIIVIGPCSFDDFMVAMKKHIGISSRVIR